MDEHTSARAARLLIDGGFDRDRVAVLVGGIRALHEASYPIETWSGSV